MESTYLNVATGNACAGQSNENPVPLVARNPTSFTDGNCGLLLDAGSKNRTRDAEDIYIYIFRNLCWNRDSPPPFILRGYLSFLFHLIYFTLPIKGHWKTLGGAQKGDAFPRGGAEP